jgi:hypothetical protein
MRFAPLLLLALPALAAPKLLLDSADIDRIRKTAASEPWAKAIVADLVRYAGEWPAQHVREYGLGKWELPQEGAGWSHDYVCPVHGVRLHQDAGKNICPVDGKDYHGWPVDNVVYMQRNDDNAEAARNLGLAFQLTGKQEYAEKARRIFTAYADIYLKLPIHDNQNRPNTKTGARVMSQTLSEAKWLTPLVFGYDLVRDAMPAAERERFESQVLRPAAEVIERYDAGKSNWQSWHNAALLSVGLVTGDQALVQKAVNGASGFDFQLRESITPDGPWFEGSWGYHFFALDPLLLTVEMTRHNRISVAHEAALKRMFDAPIFCVFPDGTLPNFNDSGLTRLTGEARWYEIGYQLFHDPRYLVVMRGRERELEALLWGAPSLPAAGTPVELSSELLPDAGVATLRVKGSDHTVAVKFGPHGGGHGHYDKLTFISYANGAHLAADPGTQAYGAKSHNTWDKMTVAHNTVAVDERTQAQSTGKLLEWNPGAEASEVRLSAGPAYPKVEIERTLVLTANYLLDIVTAHSTDGVSHKFDWFYHNFGTLTTAIPLLPFDGLLPHENGYQHLTQTESDMTGHDWQASFTQPGANLRLEMLGAADTRIVTGEGLGPDLRVPVPFVMVRREGTSARFVALYVPYRDSSPVKGFHAVGDTEFEVYMSYSRDRISIATGRFSIGHSR